MGLRASARCRPRASLLRVPTLLLAAWAAWAAPLAAQSTWWTFDTRRYFDPLRAQVRGAQTSVLFPARSDPFEFQREPGSFAAWDISLGLEIPLVGWESNSTRLGELNEGGWAVGLWLPISWHMIENLSDEEGSRPIVNTDYRFSGMLKVQWRAWAQTSVQARLSLGHESTHLGDEFSILALRRDPAGFRRVNVSHEDLAYGIGLEHFRWFRALGTTRFLVRHTGLFPVNPGYYSPELREVETDSVTAPERKYQWGVGLEMVPEMAWRPWVSVELRNRIVYGYDRPTPETPEETQLSVNLLVGTRIRDFDYAAPLSFEPYVRLYHGVNPAGQFRNDPDYTILGAGLMIRIGGW